jgi:hypothetical protein
MGLSEEDQIVASEWLGNNPIQKNINVYFYNGETDVSWLLYAVARTDVRFLSYNNNHAILDLMGGYILSKPNSFYTTADVNLKMLINHINNGFVHDITEFLEKVFNEQE